MYTDTSSIASSAYDSGDSMESKYTVAGILSSMANTEAPLPVSYSGATANLVTGSSIPLLTPTTLANLEQSFTELANNNEMPVFEPLQQPQTTHVNRESGFVPPVVIIPMNPVKQESSNYQQNTAEDLSDSDWTPPGAKRMKVTAAGSDNTLIKPTYSSPLTTTSTPGRKSTRRLNDSLLSHDELDKRQIRRDRNKQAAAKCRQRRLDLTNTLINETEGLEDEQATLENEIQNLQQQKEQLEFLLQAHQPVCSARKTNAKPHLVIKKESPTESVSTASFVSSSSSLGAGRPTSLSIPSTSHHRIVIPSSSQTATGVPISTPTSGSFMLGLDSMMDGHTGLTPITGAPTCGSQVHRNSSDSSPGEGINSPTRLLAL